MKVQKMIDGNKLIAKFMGYKVIPYGIPKKASFTQPEISENDLKYNISWDWLIPALAKFREQIDKIPFVDKQLFYSKNEILSKCVLSGDIQCAFVIFTECIEWYNSIKE